jgi:hypothetical protein
MPTRLAAADSPTSGQADAVAARVGPVSTGRCAFAGGGFVIVSMVVWVGAGDGPGAPLPEWAVQPTMLMAVTARTIAGPRLVHRFLTTAG